MRGGLTSFGSCCRPWPTCWWKPYVGSAWPAPSWRGREAGTLRLKLLKVGAVVVRNTRRVRLWFSSAFPLQELFRHCVACFYG
jgi:Transposase DDE domain group 1